MSAAVAETRIRILKIKLAILRGRSKHQRHDSRFSGIELRILLKNGKNKLIRLQGEYASRTSHCKSERNRRITTVRSISMARSPGFKKVRNSSIVSWRICFLDSSGMQPLRIFDLAVPCQIENTYFEPIQSGLRPKPQQIPGFPRLHRRPPHRVTRDNNRPARGQTTPAVSAGNPEMIYFHFDCCAGFNELLLDVFCFVLCHAFFYGFRCGFDQILGFLQSEAGNFADRLDDADLVSAHRSKDNVKLGLLLRRSRCSATTTGAGARLRQWPLRR